MSARILSPRVQLKDSPGPLSKLPYSCLAGFMSSFNVGLQAARERFDCRYRLGDLLEMCDYEVPEAGVRDIEVLGVQNIASQVRAFTPRLGQAVAESLGTG